MSFKKGFGGMAALLLLAGMLASGVLARAQDGTLQLIPPSGPYPVGRTAYHWVDDAREEVHTEDESDVRELLVEVWYPAAPAEGAGFGPYFEKGMADLFAEITQKPPEVVGSILSNAYPDAPLANDQDTYPVIVFDPGFSEAPRQYSVIIEELASHGYVVFGLSHPYLTTLTLFPDGRAIEPVNYNRLSTLWAPRDIYEAEFREVWVPDTTFVLDQIERLNAGDPQGRFTGRLNLSQIGMVGHSQGARTVSEVCLNDERCAAVVNLDGGRSANVELSYTKPYMLILADNGVEAFVSAYERGMEAIASGYYVLMIPRTQHLSFEDAAFWVPMLSNQPLPAGVEAARIAVLDYRTYIRAFMDKHVRGQDVPLLAGASEEHPEVFILLRSEPVDPPTVGAEPQAAALGGNRGQIAKGEADVWTYEGTAGEVLDIAIMADRPADQATVEQRDRYGLMDTLLAVRSPDGELLAANDDMGISTNSAVEGLELPEDGVYVIEVRTWESQSGGDYTLIVRSSLEQ